MSQMFGMLQTSGPMSSTGMDAGANASTWSQMIKEVEASKKNLAWTKEDLVPAKRIPLPERKQMERALDPVQMKFRDPQKEANYSTLKADRTITKVLNRYDKIKQSEYNVVSHQGPPRNYDKIIDQVKETVPKPARNWNLFSHLEHNAQTKCPIFFNADYMKSNIPPQTANRPTQEQREFNIVSNQYSTNHDEMLKSEYNKMKQDMVKKYWETHDYNPITTQYYEDNKELNIQAKEDTMRQTHGANNDEKLPDRYRYSEGKAYDILTLKSKDDDMIRRALRTEVKKDNRLSKFKGFQATQVAKGVAAYEKAESQHIARVGFDRWEQEINRGYDFVSTGPVVANLHRPLPKQRKTPWEKVNDDHFMHNYSSNNLQAGVGAVSSARSGQVSPTTHTHSSSETMTSARLSARMPDSSRSGGGYGSARGVQPNSVSASARSTSRVPALDLSTAHVPSSISTVRTGGLSGM
jgi:hypothetical protein